MADVAVLLLPTTIATLAPPSDDAPNPLLTHPSVLALHALSDLLNLFTPSTAPPTSSLIARPSSSLPLPPRKLTAAAQKLRFYLSFIVHADTEQVRLIAERIGDEAAERMQEAGQRKQGVAERKEGMSRGVDARPTRAEEELPTERTGPRIVEIE